MVPGGPPDEGEHTVGPEPKGPTPTIENLFVRDMAEADPAFDLALKMEQFNACSEDGIGHPGELSSSGNSRSSSARNISATVWPFRKAIILSRPRIAGVTSMVRRAV